VNGLQTEPSIGPAKLRALVVDGRASRLAIFKSAMNGCVELYSAQGPFEAFYWAERLRTVDCLILHHPSAISAKPLDLIRSLQESLQNVDKMVKVLVIDPDEAADLQNSILITPSDLVLTEPIEVEDLCKEVRKRLARLIKEKRTSLRVPIPEDQPIKVEVDGAETAVLRDLSETGMFLETAVDLSVGASRPFVLHISDLERWRVDGVVVRSMEGGLGIAFRPMDDDTRRKIFARLAETVSLKDLTELKLRYPELHTTEMVAFRSLEKIQELLEEALRAKTEITALPAKARRPVTLYLEEIEAGRICRLRGQELGLRFKTADPVFMSFQFGYATYNFETTIRRIREDGESLECFFPQILFYSEKRATKRESLGSTLRMEIVLPPPFSGEISGPIVDLTDSGASFVVDSRDIALLPGTPIEKIRILDEGRVVREERGEVRNVVRVGSNGSSGYRYGLQFGIGRLNIQTLRAHHPGAGTTDAKAAPRDALEPGLLADLLALSHQAPQIVRLENHRGEEIVGLLNSSFPLDETPVPIVIIPIQPGSDARRKFPPLGPAAGGSPL